MKETPKAKQAWADYLAMGDGRSLRKLVALYVERGGNSVAPTTRLTTLEEWAVAWDWQGRLQALKDQAIAELRSKGIADRQNRIAILQQNFQRLQDVLEERAEHYAALMAGAPEAETRFHRPGWVAPGAATGALVYSRKVANGKVITEEWAADTAVLKEIRNHLEQTAKELGQWTEKTDVTSGGKPLDLAGLVLAARAREG